MKKITCMAIMVMALFVAVPAQAQFSWGIKGGVNMVSNDLSNLSGIVQDKAQIMNKDNYTGFFIGPKAELRVPILGFGIEAAALYSQKGMSVGDNETFKQNSFQIPLNIKYSFGLGNVANVFIAAGPEFGFNVGETTKVFNNVQFDDVTGVTAGDVSAYVLEKSTLSINIGLGATLLNHLQVALNYNMPWGKTGEFQYIDASEIENAENLKNGQNISINAFEKLSGTIDKAKQATANIKAGTVQVSVAYLF
ncbi:MAG: PorT family protein [Bacteroidaceae bacterium]|nr:PorT family protein [Bacteroidaceae bacterium]